MRRKLKLAILIALVLISFGAAYMFFKDILMTLGYIISTLIIGILNK